LDRQTSSFGCGLHSDWLDKSRHTTVRLHRILCVMPMARSFYLLSILSSLLLSVVQYLCNPLRLNNTLLFACHDAARLIYRKNTQTVLFRGLFRLQWFPFQSRLYLPSHLGNWASIAGGNANGYITTNANDRCFLTLYIPLPPSHLPFNVSVAPNQLPCP